MTGPIHPASPKGSVLLVVLCVVALLSFLIVNTAFVTNQHGETQAARLGLMRAHELAEMGVAVAVHPMIKAGDPLLRRKVSEIERFEARLTTAESKLNLNKLLAEQQTLVLERVFEAWGLSIADAQGLAAILIDWTDADDLKRRPDSAEKLDYQQMRPAVMPLNRLFNSLDEIGQVPRMAELADTMPDWRQWFTLRSSGQLDLNAAEAPIIAAVTGAMPSQAERLVEQRNGLDQIRDTEDDTPLLSLDEARALLGVGDGDWTPVQPLLTLQGPTRQVTSVGFAAESTYVIEVVTSGGQGGSQIAEWVELPGELPREEVPES